MSLFGRDSDPAPVSRSTPGGNPIVAESGKKLTHVAVGSKISGLISGSTEILIDGEVEGEVKLDGRVVVGRQGKMLGNITARAVQVAGKLTGNVHGLERVELLASATLEGDVRTPRVVIAEGAFFQGRIEMKEDGTPAVRMAQKPEVPRSLVASEAASSPLGAPKKRVP